MYTRKNDVAGPYRMPVLRIGHADTSESRDGNLPASVGAAVGGAQHGNRPAALLVAVVEAKHRLYVEKVFVAEHGFSTRARRKLSRHSFQRAQILRYVHRVRPQPSQVDHFQRPRVRGCQYYGWSDTSLVRLRPSLSHDAPAITGLQTGEAVLRHRSDQVISDAALMIKELRRHHCANQVT